MAGDIFPRANDTVVIILEPAYWPLRGQLIPADPSLAGGAVKFDGLVMESWTGLRF